MKMHQLRVTFIFFAVTFCTAPACAGVKQTARHDSHREPRSDGGDIRSTRVTLSISSSTDHRRKQTRNQTHGGCCAELIGVGNIPAAGEGR